MKLKEKKEFAENLARYSAIPTFVIDSQHKVLYWNKACEELTGIKASEVTGTDSHWKAFYDSRRPCLADMVINNELSEQSEHYTKYGRSPYVSSGLHAETCISDPGGKKRYIVFDAAPIYNSEGKLVAAMETLQDHTEQKQAEQKIKRKLEIEETIAAITSMFVGPGDIDTAIEYALGEVGSLCGACRSYVFLLRENEPVMDNTHEWCHEGVEPQKENLQNLPTDMYPWWMTRLHNGEIIHVPEVSSMPPEASAEKEILQMQDIRSLIVLPLYSAGELTGFIGMDNVVNTGEWKDYEISALYMVSSVVGMALERKMAEEDLREQILFTKSIMDTTPDLMVLKDRDDVYVEVNDAFCRFLGKRREGIIGRTDFDLFPPEEASVYRADDQEVMRTGKQQNKDEPVSGDNGKRWLHVTKTAVIDTSGRCTGVLCSVSDITDRKQAEVALQESEERYRNVVELASDSIVVQCEGCLVFANPATTTLMGAKDTEDLIGKSVLDFIPPENRELFIERMQHVLDTHEPVSHIEEKLIRMDGSLIDTEVTGTFITYVGKPAILIVLHDITERKRVEEELLIKHKQLLSIFDSIDEIVYVADPDTYELLYFNEAFRSRFGGDLGDKCYEVIQDKPSPCSFCSNKYIFGDNLGKTYIWEWQNLVDRHWYRYIDRAIEWPDGRMVRYEMAIDINERKRAEEELHAAHQKLMDIIEFLPDATFVVDSEKKVIAWNRAIEEMTGVKKEDIIGKGDYAYAVPFYGERRTILIDLLSIPDSEIKQKYKYIEKKGNSLYAEAFTPSTYGGKGAHLAGKASPLFDSSGKCIGAIESIRDITDRKRAEDDLKKYAEELEDSNELKDLFTDILHHDLLNPAGIIMGYTEILSDMEEDEKKSQYLQIIERNNEKLISIIERASKFAKLQTVKELKFKTMDIGVILKEVIENFMPLIDEKQMVIEFTANGRYCANVNPVIEEVFANLLSNAIKYSPQKNRIIIDITDAGEEWRVAVTDFGEGISDEDKSRLFERFRRANTKNVKGTGLGLAIVRRLITLHGGRVGVEDNPEGHGSRFWVTVKKA